MAEETDVPDPKSSLLAFFGSEVRRVRTEAGMSQGQVAKEAHSTQAMISYIELARRVPTAQLAGDLDRVFGTGGHFQRLHPLVLRYAYPSWYLPIVQIEGDATSIRSFQSQVVPGLLQTEEYARAMLTAVRPDNLEDLIAARMSRQALFERDSPPRTWFVIDEVVLRRTIGGPKVMRGQLERLLVAGAVPRTVIQVIPERVAEHPGLAGPFAIFSLPEVPDMLYVDGFSKGRMGLDAAEVSEAVHAYDLLRAVSLSPVESAELIGGYLEGLKQ
jgi:transcriptional regulator with XRE-family HTH domain